MKLIYKKEIKNKKGIVIKFDKREICEDAKRGIYLEKAVVKRYYKTIEVEIE